MIGFITGLIVGGAAGFITGAILTVGSEEDDLMLDEFNMFDDEEIHRDCTVQIWKNTITGETSVGWWRNDKGGTDDSTHFDH